MKQKAFVNTACRCNGTASFDRLSQADEKDAKPLVQNRVSIGQMRMRISKFEVKAA